MGLAQPTMPAAEALAAIAEVIPKIAAAIAALERARRLPLERARSLAVEEAAKATDRANAILAAALFHQSTASDGPLSGPTAPAPAGSSP